MNRGGVPLDFYEGGWGLKKIYGVGSREILVYGVGGHFAQKKFNRDGVPLNFYEGVGV